MSTESDLILVIEPIKPPALPAEVILALFVQFLNITLILLEAVELNPASIPPTTDSSPPIILALLIISSNLMVIS